jgi:two-component sensor histidine kinase
MADLYFQNSPPPEQLLLNELNHRINNKLASIIGVVSSSASRSDNDDVKLALGRVTDLLSDCADVHHALRMPQDDVAADAADYLRRLCISICRSKLDHMKIQLVLAISPLRLSSQQCWQLGMIVHELITNAARHAVFKSGGEIRVELEPSSGLVECTVSDNGATETAIRPGLGMSIVRELAKALDGTVDQYFGQQGSISVVTFPLRDDLQNSIWLTDASAPLTR